MKNYDKVLVRRFLTHVEDGLHPLGPLHIYAYIDSDVVHISVVLGVASQLSNLWRNDSGYTGKQNMFKQDCWGFLYTPKYAINAI